MTLRYTAPADIYVYTYICAHDSKGIGLSRTCATQCTGVQYVYVYRRYKFFSLLREDQTDRERERMGVGHVGEFIGVIALVQWKSGKE